MTGFVARKAAIVAFLRWWKNRIPGLKSIPRRSLRIFIMELRLLSADGPDRVDPDGDTIREVLTKLPELSGDKPSRAVLVHDNGKDFIQFLPCLGKKSPRAGPPSPAMLNTASTTESTRPVISARNQTSARSSVFFNAIAKKSPGGRMEWPGSLSIALEQASF